MEVNTLGMLDYNMNQDSTWQARGYCGKGHVDNLIGSLHGRTAIVCGGAVGVFEELENIRERIDDTVVFAANDVGMYIHRLDHWCTLHSKNMSAWKNVRWLHDRGPENVFYHSIEASLAIDYVWEGLTPVFALSGYFAMQLAYIMDAEHIILCGCPGSVSPRFFEAGEPSTSVFERYAGQMQKQVIEEMQRLPEFRLRVRSMSGWTRDFFGGM